MERLYYDSECGFCVSSVRRFERVLARRGFSLVRLQSPGAGSLLGVSEADLLTEMRVRFDDGTVVGGAVAVAAIARRIWWAWPLWAISRVPGAMALMRVAYRYVARNRYCLNNVCEITPGGR